MAKNMTKVKITVSEWKPIVVGVVDDRVALGVGEGRGRWHLLWGRLRGGGVWSRTEVEPAHVGVYPGVPNVHGVEV